MYSVSTAYTDIFCLRHQSLVHFLFHLNSAYVKIDWMSKYLKWLKFLPDNLLGITDITNFLMLGIDSENKSARSSMLCQPSNKNDPKILL